MGLGWVVPTVHGSECLAFKKVWGISWLDHEVTFFAVARYCCLQLLRNAVGKYTVFPVLMKKIFFYLL
jgi:hypothetical protein